MKKKYGFLTKIQLVSLYYKSRGYSYRRIAEIIGTSHQNIAVAYRRALKNIELSEKTIIYYKLSTAKIVALINEGTHLADIPRLIIEECDKRGVKLRADFTLIFKQIRFYTPQCVSGSRLAGEIIVVVDKHGFIQVYSYREIKDIISNIEKILGKPVISIRYGY
ncbi:Tfx family DNA-binding protein [Staphylothermus hellenicus]|nr:Tfx family DNA-binding protein [Staphylothermus hellenicus]